MNFRSIIRMFFVLVVFFGGLRSVKAQQTEATPIPEDLLTVAEASQYEATSTSAEVNRFLAACDARADHVTQFEYGRTSLDQPMTGIVIASSAVTAPPKDDRLVVLLLGNIHSGECDGKEALLMLARELTLNPNHPWLQKLIIVMAPNYNADGNDNMAPDNRPGQIGPLRGMGKRETAQGFDLNRDFMKLETPEGRALVRLIDRWNPHVFIDCHTTNGSIHRYPLTYDIAHNPAVASELRDYLRNTMMPEVTRSMKSADIDTFYYGNFSMDYTRWETYGFEPRYSIEYLALRGRIGILSESYSYTDYKTRIDVTREFVRRCLDFTVQGSDRIAALLASIEKGFVEVAATKPSDLQIAVDAQMAPFDRKEVVLGRLPNSETPKDYEVEFWGNFQPKHSVPLPWAYVIPAAETKVLANLQAHGIHVEQLQKAVSAKMRVQTVASSRRNARAFQGHNLVTVESNSREEERELPEGTLIVRTAQPLGRVAVWLLEPTSVDGLTTWNFFDHALKDGSDFPVMSIGDPSSVPLAKVAAPDTSR